jgi:hypothetical protein
MSDTPAMPEPGSTLRTLCFNCEGRREFVVPRAAFIDGEHGTAPEVKPCQVCGGEGWLDGIQPPV